MLPVLSVEKEIDSPITPNEYVLAALAEGPIQAAAGDPFVESLDAQPEETSQLGRGENDGEVIPGRSLEGSADLSWA
jgi:hypothetical protein